MKRALVALAVVAALFVAPAFGQSVRAYVIVANINDDKLVLADRYGSKHVVEAKTYCLGTGWEEGTIVLSTENLDICVSSTLISRTTGDTCDVWCP